VAYSLVLSRHLFELSEALIRRASASAQRDSTSWPFEYGAGLPTTLPRRFWGPSYEQFAFSPNVTTVITVQMLRWACMALVRIRTEAKAPNGKLKRRSENGCTSDTDLTRSGKRVISRVHYSMERIGWRSWSSRHRPIIFFIAPLLRYNCVSLLSSFKKIRVGLCNLHAVCEFPVSTFKAWNESSWNLVCISWHLSPSQRRTS
jgi:hypothetical protein